MKCTPEQEGKWRARIGLGVCFAVLYVCWCWVIPLGGGDGFKGVLIMHAITAVIAAFIAWIFGAISFCRSK